MVPHHHLDPDSESESESADSESEPETAPLWHTGSERTHRDGSLRLRLGAVKICRYPTAI